jgi:hypothetical protein
MQVLVKAYKTTDNADQTETLYAVYENGAICKTNPRLVKYQFRSPGPQVAFR